MRHLYLAGATTSESGYDIVWSSAEPRLDEELARRARTIIRDRYADLGATLAGEKARLRNVYRIFLTNRCGIPGSDFQHELRRRSLGRNPEFRHEFRRRRPSTCEFRHELRGQT
ncbi:hypothetical protein F9946_32180 [Burkholderia thailandensis]|nr:hypothetical protein [Burkholderia thailandensis]